jgi:UDP-3-O-[3-hydroxymyristoyl] glucosamine N-acyltransferase
MQVKELAAFIHAAWEGDGDLEILRVASLDDAGSEAGGDALSFVTRGRAAKNAGDSRAACMLVPPDYPNPEKRTVIRVPDPRAAAARIIPLLHPQVAPQPGIHPSAIVSPGAVIAPSTHIGALVSIGDRVHIGANCVIHPRVTIYPDVSIGDSVILHSGCVIGADGFGLVFTGAAYEKFPQIGRVEIGDRVEIGANSCIDRAALGVTSIGEGTKLDNLVHVGHNCRIGRHVVVAAQTGFSGGVIVEDYAIIGGQVGIGDKARIESRAVIGSGAGILTSKIVRAGQVVWGTPARPLKEYLAQLAVLSRLAKKKASKQ